MSLVSDLDVPQLDSLAKRKLALFSNCMLTLFSGLGKI